MGFASPLLLFLLLLLASPLFIIIRKNKVKAIVHFRELCLYSLLCASLHGLHSGDLELYPVPLRNYILSFRQRNGE